MQTKINNDSMSLEIDGHVIASADCRDHAATETWTSRLPRPPVHPEPGCAGGAGSATGWCSSS